jgi:hypothetical protein
MHQLVDQPRLDEAADEGGAAGGADGAAVLLLQVGDEFGHGSLDQLGVLPVIDRFECRGGHVLRRVVDERGERLVVRRRPVASPLLEGGASEQDGVLALEDAPQGGTHLVVEGVLPLVGGFDDAVDGAEQAGGELAHPSGSFRWGEPASPGPAPVTNRPGPIDTPDAKFSGTMSIAGHPFVDGMSAAATIGAVLDRPTDR